MKRKLIAILAVLTVSFAIFALSRWATATPVFSDNFSTGNFANWSETYISPGSSQTVSNGIARFIVPTPQSEKCTYSYLKKDGFTSTVNSTITAVQDIYVTKVPNGCPQGNGAIFFFFICDSTDATGNHGNFGVGIDGSNVWSLWIGGSSIYTYLFQTAGSPPLSNKWYRIELTVNNPAQTVTLTVDGTVTINATQQEFTDRTHAISLWSGMGENWWSQSQGQQEIDVDNVTLDISDANPTVTPPTSPTQIQTSMPTQNIAPTPTQTVTNESTESTTPNPSSLPSPQPSPMPSPTPTAMQASTSDFPLWVVLPVVVAVVVCAGVVITLRKR